MGDVEEPGAFQTRSTSRTSADATPIVLRQTDQVRLVFKPTLVSNPKDADAAVHGEFVYQRKRPSNSWEDIQSISLASLKADEGVRLELRAAEVRLLWEELDKFYTMVAEQGIPVGDRKWVAVPATPLSSSVQDLLTKSGDERVQLLRVFVDWLKAQDASRLTSLLGPAGLGELVNFDAAIGAARLTRFIAEAEANSTNSSEGHWQGLLQRHSWVLSQVYAHPLVIIRGQAYVGGKNIANTGGNFADFLYKNKLTENTLVVEIKTPVTPLLTAQPYRNRVYGVSSELSGATQQLLKNRDTLVQEYRSLVEPDSDHFQVFHPMALLVVGTTPLKGDRERCQSFELYRRNLRDVDVVTFDELVEKARLLLGILEGA